MVSKSHHVKTEIFAGISSFLATMYIIVVESLIGLQVWAEANLQVYQKVKEKIKDLCAKSARFALAYEFDTCYRTSNQIDRPMNILDRYLYQIF